MTLDSIAMRRARQMATRDAYRLFAAACFALGVAAGVLWQACAR